MNNYITLYGKEITMWCERYKSTTTLVTECECKTCFMCEYCEPEDGEEEDYDY